MGVFYRLLLEKGSDPSLIPEVSFSRLICAQYLELCSVGLFPPQRDGAIHVVVTATAFLSTTVQLKFGIQHAHM